MQRALREIPGLQAHRALLVLPVYKVTKAQLEIQAPQGHRETQEIQVLLDAQAALDKHRIQELRDLRVLLPLSQVRLAAPELHRALLVQQEAQELRRTWQVRQAVLAAPELLLM